jgi:hypothetical protein
MQNTQNELEHKECSVFEDSLLVRDFVQKAFINLSKTNEPFTKDELIKETKILIKKNIVEQIREKKIHENSK